MPEEVQIAPRSIAVFESIAQHCCDYVTSCINQHAAVDFTYGLCVTIRTKLEHSGYILDNCTIEDTDDEDVLQVCVGAVNSHKITDHIHMRITIDTTAGTYELV